MAARWSEEYARCRACWAHGPDRPHLDGGLCVVCYGDLYGLTGLADVPPDWAEEGSAIVSIAEYREKHGVPPTPFVCVGWWDDNDQHHRCETSIAKDANVRINGPAYALWGREVAAVEVLYDRARRALALRPCAESLPHARKLRPDKAARCCSLRAFQSATGLLGEATRVVVPQLVGGLLILDLA